MAVTFPPNPSVDDTVTGDYGEVYTFDGVAWSLTVGMPMPPVAIAFSFPGQPLVGTALGVAMIYPVTIAANMTGSIYRCATTPAANAVWTVNQRSNGTITPAGTITNNTGSTSAVFSGPGNVLAIGDVLQIVAPTTQDTLLANVSITIMATRS